MSSLKKQKKSTKVVNLKYEFGRRDSVNVDISGRSLITRIETLNKKVQPVEVDFGKHFFVFLCLNMFVYLTNTRCYWFLLAKP